MIVPVLPLLVAVFADTPAHVRLIVSLYLAGIGAGQLVYGPVSDRFGRRPVLLAGLAAFLLGTALCGAAWSLPALIAGRVLQALGACAGIVLSRAMIRDVYEREAAARGLAVPIVIQVYFNAGIAYAPNRVLRLSQAVACQMVAGTPAAV